MIDFLLASVVCQVLSSNSDVDDLLVNVCARPGCNRHRYEGHPFCGKTCARFVTGRVSQCSRPGCNRPRHRNHPFCGRTCARRMAHSGCPRHHGMYCGQSCPCCRARAGEEIGICPICAPG